jgi:predicted alpha/beta hydrolase
LAGDWLPPKEPGEPEWAAWGTARLDASLRRFVVSTVVAVLVAGVFLFSGLLVPAAGILAVAAVPGYWSYARARQADAARRTGWRTATVTLTGVGTTGTAPTGTAAVRFSDGSRIDLRLRESGSAVRAVAGLPGLPALVAGAGPAMTVLIPPKPPWREKPVVFAARAETYRWLPES